MAIYLGNPWPLRGIEKVGYCYLAEIGDRKVYGEVEGEYGIPSPVLLQAVTLVKQVLLHACVR